MNPAPTFVLIAKPRVYPMHDNPKWCVSVLHETGVYVERWRTHEAALNCARAIALNSQCRPINPQAAVMAW